jgi:hypothetical protein
MHPFPITCEATLRVVGIRMGDYLDDRVLLIFSTELWLGEGYVRRDAVRRLMESKTAKQAYFQKGLYPWMCDIRIVYLSN